MDITPGTLQKNLARWRNAQQSVEEVVSTLAHVERHAIEEVQSARTALKRRVFDDEQVRNVEKEQSRQVRTYLEIVQHAISIRNKVEQELFFSGPSALVQRGGPTSCRAEGGSCG